MTIDGRFENYSDSEFDSAYDIVDHRGDWRALTARWGVTRVVTRNPRAIRDFVADGWTVRFAARGQVVLDRPKG